MRTREASQDMLYTGQKTSRPPSLFGWWTALVRGRRHSTENTTLERRRIDERVAGGLGGRV